MSTNFVYMPPQDPMCMVYEDDDLIVIDKPAGLLSVMGRLPEHQDSAYLRIRQQYPLARVTHRLDMATSGLLMFAKHRRAEIAISKLFQTRCIQKYYIALVDGEVQAQGMVEAPLITDWPNRPKQKIDFVEGKAAKTCYQPLDYNAAFNQTRIQLEPITGRSHQLRVHMQHIGHPIMGDKLYHPEPAKFALKRMALHATSLKFIQPFTQQPLDIVATVTF